MTKKIRKITFVCYCMAEDAEEVKNSLFHDESDTGWFYDEDCLLANPSVKDEEPTDEEEKDALESMDGMELDGMEDEGGGCQ